MNALVVDDSRSMRSILARILTQLGAQVSQAGDGKSALALLESGPLPDIALVDWHMPIMDGLQFVSAVRRRPEWRPMAIMMVSTESDRHHIVQALAAGANEYIMKPFTKDAVQEKLELLGIAVLNIQTKGNQGESP